MNERPIKQLAICTTQNGVIGVGDNLAVLSERDMMGFYRFTQGTVLIAGCRTADQMIKAGVMPQLHRPLVVISAESVVCESHVSGEQTRRNLRRHTHYAKDLESAIKLAEQVAIEYVLSGWTVVGGKRVYDDFLESDFELDAVYLAAIETLPEGVGDPDEFVRLAAGSDLADILNSKLGGWRVETRETAASVALRHPAGERAEMVFVQLFNALRLDPQDVHYGLSGMLQVAHMGGTLSVPMKAITGYSCERERESVTLYIEGRPSETVRLRNSGSAGKAYLCHLLNKSIVTNLHVKQGTPT